MAKKKADADDAAEAVAEAPARALLSGGPFDGATALPAQATTSTYGLEWSIAVPGGVAIYQRTDTGGFRHIRTEPIY